MMDDHNEYNNKFILEAIKLSKESLDAGFFPAGALIVRDNKIVAKSISSAYPKANIHAETTVVDEAMNKFNKQLNDFVVYASMESCLMCVSRAYWAGVRKVYYALRKSTINSKGFEGKYENAEIIKTFDEKFELIHLPEYEDDALKVVNLWLNKNK